MTTHTKEPWTRDDESGWIVGADGMEVVSTSDMEVNDQDRMIECVNACANINPAAFPAMKEALEAMLKAATPHPQEHPTMNAAWLTGLSARRPNHDHGHCSSKPMVKSLPFFMNGRGKTIHRVKAGDFHYFHGIYSHASVSYWCGNCGFPERSDHKPAGQFFADMPEGAVECLLCSVAWNRKRRRNSPCPDSASV